MDKLRRYKGITLISLVVTIIILIILAGISISMILENEGLLNKAKYATESYSNAQQQEEINIAKYSNDINSYVSGNRDYTPISYSTDEQDTGVKWIDGSTIYQKTIEGSFSTGKVGSYWGQATLVPNMSRIIYAVGYYSNYGSYCAIPEINILNSSAGTVELATANGRTLTAITLQYTKTTPTSAN